MQLLRLRPQRSGRANGNEPDRWVFTVPARIARLLPEGQTYECRLTEDGVLFAPMDDTNGPPVLPGWLSQ